MPDISSDIAKILTEEQLARVKRYLVRQCQCRNSKNKLSVVFDLLHECDINCIGCGTNSIYVDLDRKITPDLSYTGVVTILEKIKTYAQKHSCSVFINYGGGEPFLRQDLFQIVKYTYELFGHGSVGIDTNATLPDAYERIMNMLPYISYLGISINGLQEYHNWWANNRSFDAFERATDVVRKICKTDSCQDILEVTSVATTRNIQEWPRLIEYLVELGVKRYSIHRAIPVGRMFRVAGWLIPTWKEYLLLMAKAVEASESFNIQVHLHHSIEAVFGNLLCGLNTLYENYYIDKNYRSSLGIEPTGELIVDPWCAIDYWKKLSMGNLLNNDDSIDTIINSNYDMICKIRECYEKNNRCNGCNRECSGGSRVAAAAEFLRSSDSEIGMDELFCALKAIDPVCPVFERKLN